LTEIALFSGEYLAEGQNLHSLAAEESWYSPAPQEKQSLELPEPTDAL
jgi:hypothetical protein